MNKLCTQPKHSKERPKKTDQPPPPTNSSAVSVAACRGLAFRCRRRDDGDGSREQPDSDGSGLAGGEALCVHGAEWAAMCLGENRVKHGETVWVL